MKVSGSRLNLLFRTILVALVASAAAFYFWIAGQSSPNAYYQPFLEGYAMRLAAGHADLAERPDPSVLALADPYDPSQASQAKALFDASYYRGRYYSYFGITPFATLLAPGYLLTGRVMPAATAIGLYAAAGLAAAVACLLAVRSTWHPRGGRFAVLLGTSALGFGTPVLMLLRRPVVYELEIAAAFFHVALALCCAVLAFRSPRGRVAWIAAASLSLGLAAGCRPTCALLAPVFLAWCAAAFRRDGPRFRPEPAALAAAFLPLAAVGLGLAWFNWIRFGNPLEFGFRYQLVSYDRMRVGFWGLRNIGYNLRLYLFGGARLSPYFPFFLGESGAGALPAGHEATDQVYGCLLFCPLLWILVCAWLPFRAGGGQARFFGLLLAVAACSFAPFLAMGNGAYRYLADFLPPALLAAAVVWMEVEERAARSTRGALRAVAFGLLCATCLSAICQQFALYDIFQISEPAWFDRLSRWVNQPVYRVQEAAGIPAKVPYLRMIFPSDRFGRDEPLFVCGRPAEQDFLYAYYPARGEIQIGFESDGHGGPLSAPIPIDYGKEHVLVLYYGSFVPPAGHPLLRGLSGDEVADLRSSLVVTLDGTPVLDTWAFFHRPRQALFWGRSPDDDAFGRRFTGSFLRPGFTRARARPSPSRTDPAGYGACIIEAEGLEALRSGDRAPLLSLGYHPSGTIVFLERMDPARARLGLAGYGTATIYGDPFPFAFGARHRFELELGSLYPAAGSQAWPPTVGPAARAALKARVRLAVDGRAALETTASTPDVSPVAVVPGRNTIGLSEVGPALPGKIVSVRRAFMAP